MIAKIQTNHSFSSPEIDASAGTAYDTKGTLSEGTYYWKVRARDHAEASGFTAARSFTLDCTDPYCYNLEIINPVDDETYNNRRILIDLSINRDVKYIYKALNSRFFTRICSNCNAALKEYSAKEGLNNLTIKILGYNGEVLLHSIFFTIDTKKPRVSKIEPKDKSWVSGTLFTVKYTEYNVESISLFYGNGVMNEILLSNCPNGRKVECSVDVDLDDYDGQQIQYYFVIRDKFNEVMSKTYTLNIDTSSPVLVVISPENSVYDTRRVRITATTNEKVTMEYSDNGRKFKRLCRNCGPYNRTKTFKDGTHTLLIKATDKAGNVAITVLNFEVDSKKPSISRIEPRNKAYTNGSFSIRYTEENVKGVSLFYSASPENEAIIFGCPSGRYVYCYADVDLSAYDGQQIQYYFVVRDNFNTIASKTYTVNVDTTIPILDLISPLDGTDQNRRVRLTAEMSEKVMLEYSDNEGRFKKLCSRCDFYNRTRYFRTGSHELVVRASDKAGNVAEQSVSFTVA